MLWARRHVFVGQYGAHVRLDSSPQFGKDFLMGETDVVRTEGRVCVKGSGYVFVALLLDDLYLVIIVIVQDIA
jgi:hypothetical protein